MKKQNIVLKSILAGIMIGLSCVTYLNIENNIIGSLFFGIGLFIIVNFNLLLFTGIIGTTQLNLYNICKLIIILICNYIGTLLFAISIKYTRIFNKTFIDKANNIINIKLNDDIISIFVLSIFCGMLMYIAVKMFNNSKNGLLKIIGLFLPISVFVINGFEHCIANMFYINITNNNNIQSILYILIMIIGNTIGSKIMTFYATRKFTLYNTKDYPK